jgi:serine/threonine-protein kinase
VSLARATTPAELVADLEAGIDALVCTALAKDPSRRYADAAEMAQAIATWLRDGNAISLIETTASAYGDTAEATAPRPADRPAKPASAAAPEPGPDARSDTIPAEWGHLQILGKLGEGMFGEVYKCLDPSLQTVRALKVNRARGKGGRAAAEIAERALREGRLLARVEHPNVVRVLGAAVHDDAVGMWMEYVEGRNLEEFLQQNGRLSNAEVAVLGRDLASALAAVHAKGVIHRDIKAQNVIREVGGRVVLTDFGSGFDLAGHATVTEKIAGTPLYMAPEVLHGGTPTPQSDIYSLGVLLFRMATGKFPIESDSWDGLLAKHARGDTPLVRDVEPDIRQPIARVIEKALSSEPGKRYATAGEMLGELEAIVTPPDPRRWLPVALAGATAAIAGLGLLLLVGVVATLTFQMSLGIPSNFVAASLGDYLITGFRAMIPGTISILICSFIIWSGLRIGRYVASKIGLRHESLGPMPLGRRFVAVGLIGMVVAYFAYGDLWTAISALRYSGMRGEADFSLLSNVSYQIVHEWAYAFLASAMLVGMGAVWYRARERGDGGARLLGLQASMAAIALLAILRMSMGWKLLVEPQPTFIYQPDADATARWIDPRARTGDLTGARGFVLGRDGDELWVYFPEVLHGMPLAASSIEDPTETEGIFYYGAATTTNR